MVMEDFGDVDLFDFIDQVSLDESLACHLFRQVSLLITFYVGFVVLQPGLMTVSIMWPTETEDMVSQLCLMCGST